MLLLDTKTFAKNNKTYKALRVGLAAMRVVLPQPLPMHDAHANTLQQQQQQQQHQQQ